MSLLSLRFLVYVTLSVTPYVTGQNDCDSSVLCDGPQLSMEFEDPIGEIECNAYLTPEQAEPQPTFTWQGGEQDELYMIVGIDPDVPSCANPFMKWARHMLVGDLSAADLASGNISDGYIATAYFGPGPPAGTGIHRYQWLVYSQPGPMGEMVDVPSPGDLDILSWDVEKFLTDNGVDPESYVAAKQFRSSRE